MQYSTHPNGSSCYIILYVLFQKKVTTIEQLEQIDKVRAFLFNVHDVFI